MTSVDLLNYGWSGYLSSIMGLDASTFQLAQGTLGLQTADSSGLFLMADAVPPSGSVHFYDPTSMTKRSSAYFGLLNALLPESNPQGLSKALGPNYKKWIAWKETNPPNASETYLAYFQRWEMLSSVEPARLARAELAITDAQNSPLIAATTAYTNPVGWQTFIDTAGTSYKLPIYSATRESAIAAIANGASINSLNFDSGNITNRKAPLNAAPTGATTGAGAVNFFGGSAGSPVARPGPGSLALSATANGLTQLNAKASNQRVTITGNIGSYATLPSSPGSWYSSYEVSRAWKGKGNTKIWDAGASSGGWKSFFGAQDGSLARYISQLILISNYELTVTVNGQFTANDVSVVRQLSLSGTWPLFSAGSTPPPAFNARLNSDSSMSVVYKLDAGKIQIWGVTVQDMKG